MPYCQATVAIDGLVQQRDKIMAHFALTIYPYSLCRKEAAL